MNNALGIAPGRTDIDGISHNVLLLYNISLSMFAHNEPLRGQTHSAFQKDEAQLLLLAMRLPEQPYSCSRIACLSTSQALRVRHLTSVLFPIPPFPILLFDAICAFQRGNIITEGLPKAPVFKLIDV